MPPSAAYDAFRARLRRARQLAGLSQAEVARRLGKPRSFVSKCESGERRVDAVELGELADLYSVPVTYFFERRRRPARRR